MSQTSQDILRGGPAIADWLGVGKNRVWALVRDGKLPVFKLGGTIYARKSTLCRWIEDQEKLSIEKKDNDKPTTK